MTDIEYTEGVCDDGAAILADGRMMRIEEVIETLNASNKHLNLIQALSILIKALTAALKPFSDLAGEIPDENFWPSNDMANINRAHEAYMAAIKEGF